MYDWYEAGRTTWRVHPKRHMDADVVLPIDLENAYGRACRSTCLEAARGAGPQLAAICAARWNGNCATRGSGRDATMAGLLRARRGEAGRVPSCASYVCAWTGVCPQVRCNSPAGGHEDSAHGTASTALWLMRVTDFVGTNAEVGRLGLSSLRTRSCRQRFATCARRSGAGSVFLDLWHTCNMACMWACIERFACDQHDHVSFAKAWMLVGKGVAHALDYDFRLLPQAVMAPLQRRLEGGALSPSWKRCL